MASFIGTDRRDVITPTQVSSGVATEPGFPFPSDLDDSILGGRGHDRLLSGGGNDTVVGGKGDDDMRLGDGDDLATWAKGDGSDSVHGVGGFDTVAVEAGPQREKIDLVDGFFDATLFIDYGARLDLDAVERVEIHAGTGGGDYVAISDLSGTQVEEVLVTFGPGTRINDMVFIGTGEAESISLARTPGGNIVVQGLGVETEIAGFVAERDKFILSLGEGGDNIDARAFSGANLIVAAGSGDDLGKLGNGDDRWAAVGGFGADTVEGGGGIDTLDLDASIQDDIIILAGDASAATATRGTDSVAMTSIERIEVESASGNDLVDGSAITRGIRLFLWGGAGADTLVGGARGDKITGGAGDDSMTGGARGDHFVLGAENGDGRQDLDIITDFSKAEGDLLDLRGLQGGHVAEVTAEGVLVTFAEGDMDQVLLRGLTAVSDIAVLA